LLRAQVGVLEQCLPGGLVRCGQRGRVRERDGGGGGREDLRRRGDELGGGPIGDHRQESDHLLAGRPPRHARTEGDDCPGRVDARDVRERDRKDLLQVARADPGVDRIERGGRHLDEHLTLRRLRPLGVLMAQHARVAVVVVSNRLHRKPPCDPSTT
jgi:hypothetical protein